MWSGGKGKENIRNAFRVRTLFFSAASTSPFVWLIYGVALIANPPHAHAWFLVRTWRSLRWRVGVARIAIGILFEIGSRIYISSLFIQRNMHDGNVRIAWAFLAADVPASSTLPDMLLEDTLAPMAEATNAAPNRFVDQILATRARGNGEKRVGLLDLPLLVLLLASLGLGLPLLLFGSGLLLFLGTDRRIARALLATDVLAARANLVTGESGLAAMAGAANTHTNRLLDALDVQFLRRHPLMGLQGEAIFGEEGTGTFLLHVGPIDGDRAAGGSGGKRLGRLDIRLLRTAAHVR